MNKTRIEKQTVELLLRRDDFNSETYQLNLEHMVENAFYWVQDKAKDQIKKYTERITNNLELIDKWNPSITEYTPDEYLEESKKLYAVIKKLKTQKDVGISYQRIKDLVQYTLEIKQNMETEKIKERMNNIFTGERENHLIALKELKSIYMFKEDDLMKISCWLTQVKRTAKKLELKCPTALVFYSPQKATGKSTFMTLIKKAVLSSYIDNPKLKNFSIEEIFTRFRPIELIQDLVITIDEIGYMNKDITAQLKSLITDTNEISIEQKFQKPFFGRKMANFMITSNNEPADLFYTDAHERRLSVIDNFHINIEMSMDELYKIIEKVWLTTPIEYAYDTNELMNKNMNRIRTNDEIFEGLVKLYQAHELETPRYFTVNSLFVRLQQHEMNDINKKLLRSFMETTPKYFRLMDNPSGRNNRFKLRDELFKDLEKESNI